MWLLALNMWLLKRCLSMENTENQVITHLKIEGDRQDRPCIDRNKAFRDRG